MNNVLTIHKIDNFKNKQLFTNNYMSENRLNIQSNEKEYKKTTTNLSLIPLNFTKMRFINEENVYIKDASNNLIIRKDTKSSINSVVLKKFKKIYNFNYYSHKLNLKELEKVIKNYITYPKIYKKISKDNSNYNLDLSSKSRSFHTYSPISPLKFIVKKNKNDISNNYYCILCNNCFYFKDKIIILNNCKHIICKNCFKLFFENQIEKGENMLNCPLYKCNKEIDIQLLKNNIQNNYFDLYLENIDKKKFIKQNTKYTIGNIFNKNEKIYERFNKKHVAEITNDEEIYYSFNKVKSQFCPFCGVNKIFNIPQWSVIKCLNCLKWYCKYCFKEVDNEHFNKFNENYCRVYSLKNRPRRKIQRKNFLKSNKLSILIIKTYGSVILGYIMFFLALINIYWKLFNRKNNKYIIKFLFNFVLAIMFIFYIIVLIIIFIIFIPFYPLLNDLMDIILDNQSI